ncbi:MAG: hypothetical protein ACLUTO_12775 [Anaerostipes sp.]
MARTDEPIKKLFKNKENFADLFNATIFQGEQIIKPDKLIEISTEDIHIKDISVQKRMYQVKFQMIRKETKQQNDLELRQNAEGKYYRRKLTKNTLKKTTKNCNI